MFEPVTLRREQPGTYFVQDRSNEEELTRLQIQDREMTRAIGGRIAEQLELDPTAMQRVLDVGCGSGAWLIEIAQSYPTIPALVGIDINTRVPSLLLAELMLSSFQTHSLRSKANIWQIY